MLSFLAPAAGLATDPTGALGALYSFLLLLFLTVVTLLIKVTLDLRALKRHREASSSRAEPVSPRIRPQEPRRELPAPEPAKKLPVFVIEKPPAKKPVRKKSARKKETARRLIPAEEIFVLEPLKK